MRSCHEIKDLEVNVHKKGYKVKGHEIGHKLVMRSKVMTSEVMKSKVMRSVNIVPVLHFSSCI